VNANAKTPELPNGVLYEIQKMYYDTAQAYNQYTLPTFTKVVPLSHILYGTDYPFAQPGTVTKGLTEFGFSAADLRAIERDNALALFPRLKTLMKDSVKKAVRDWLTDSEIEAMMLRRDLLVAHFTRLIAELGEEKVLY